MSQEGAMPLDDKLREEYDETVLKNGVTEQS
jgi:hypothetical protein